MNRYITLLSICILIFSGCNPDKPATMNVENPFTNVTLQVAVPPGLMSLEDWKSLSQDWETRTRVPVKFVELSADYPHDKTQAATYVQQLKELNPQLVIIPWNLKSLLVSEQILSPLPSSILDDKQLDWGDYFQGFKKNISMVDDKPALVPLALPTLKLFYRKDLLEQANLSPPKTWEDLLTLLEKKESWAPGKSITLPLGEKNRQAVILSTVMPYVVSSDSLSFCYDFSSGTSRTDHPGFKKSLELLEKILKHTAPASSTATTADCLRLLLSGETPLTITSEDTLAELIIADPNTSLRAKELKFGISPMPGTNEQFDSLKNAWVPFSSERIHRVTLIDQQGYAAAVTNLSPEANDLAEKTKLAASNLLQELIKSGMLDSSGKTLLTPVKLNDLTSNIATLPELFAFQEQTDILETTQTQLQGKLFFAPALLPQDDFHQLWQQLSAKIVEGTPVPDVLSLLNTQNAKLIESHQQDYVRKMFRAQLGLSIAPVN